MERSVLVSAHAVGIQRQAEAFQGFRAGQWARGCVGTVSRNSGGRDGALPL